jgi:hypothetical protein
MLLRRQIPGIRQYQEEKSQRPLKTPVILSH